MDDARPTATPRRRAGGTGRRGRAGGLGRAGAFGEARGPEPGRPGRLAPPEPLLDEVVGLARGWRRAGRGRADGARRGRRARRRVGRLRPGGQALGRDARAQQHLAEPELRGLADDADHLLRALAGHGDGDVLVPCCCTRAPLNPARVDARVFMMAMAWVIAPWLGVTWPFAGTAFRVMVVPLDRSRPSPTLKLLCHLAGWTMFARSTPASIDDDDHGQDDQQAPWPGVVVGGATCRQSLGDPASGAARWSGRCGHPAGSVSSGAGLRARLALGRGPPWSSSGDDSMMAAPEHLDLHARGDLHDDVPVVARDDRAVDAGRGADPLARHDLALRLPGPAAAGCAAAG